MDVSNMKRLKELEAENARLKKMYAVENLRTEIVAEARVKPLLCGHCREDTWSICPIIALIDSIHTELSGDICHVITNSLHNAHSVKSP